MIGTSRTELVFIRTSIFLLQYSIPVCLALLAVLQCTAGVLSWWGSGVGLPPSPAVRFTSSALAVIAVLDSFFALLVYLPYRRRAQRLAVYPPALSPSQRRDLFKACMDNIPDREAYLRGWFLGADLRDIRRENVREFLAWAFFDRDVAMADGHGGPELSSDEEEEMRGYLDEIDRLLRLSGSEVGLPPGRGPAKSLRLNVDDVNMCFRSIVWYAIVMLVDIYTHVSMLRGGFQYYAAPMSTTLAVLPPRPLLWLPAAIVPRRPSPAPPMAYWYRPHTSRTRRPVLFFHGIGIGLLTYMGFLSEVARGGEDDDDGQVGVIAPEIMPISMRYAGAPLDKHAFLGRVSAILAHHGWLEREGAGGDGTGSGFVLVSHSYGSALTTHVLRDAALGPHVASLVLVDPVSLMLHLPDVAFNFTRRRPRRANEWQLWFFASTDPSTATTLGRHFFWQHNAVWKEELFQRGDEGGRHPSDTRDAAEAGAPPSPCPDQALLQAGGWGDGCAIGRAAAAVGTGFAAGGAAGFQKRKVAVSLAGSDIIVDVRRVAQYLLSEEGVAGPTPGDQGVYLDKFRDGETPIGEPLAPEKARACATKSGIEVLYFPTLDHAQVFDRPAERRRLVQVVRKYCRAKIES